MPLPMMPPSTNLPASAELRRELPGHGGNPAHVRCYARSDMPWLALDAMVESRMGAVAWGQWPAPRFPSPLIEPDVPISGIRLSDWLHRKAHGVTDQGRRSRRSRPSSP